MKEVELGGASGTSGGEKNCILGHEGRKPLRRHNRRRKSAIMSYVCDNINTLRTGDANLRFLRFCITTVKDK
jgi:hypothetical protein